MNNEEKILAMLEKLTEEVGRHSEMLAKQGEILTTHSEMPVSYTHLRAHET